MATVLTPVRCTASTIASSIPTTGMSRPPTEIASRRPPGPAVCRCRRRGSRPPAPWRRSPPSRAPRRAHRPRARRPGPAALAPSHGHPAPVHPAAHQPHRPQHQRQDQMAAGHLEVEQQREDRDQPEQLQRGHRDVDVLLDAAAHHAAGAAAAQGQQQHPERPEDDRGDDVAGRGRGQPAEVGGVRVGQHVQNRRQTQGAAKYQSITDDQFPGVPQVRQLAGGTSRCGVEGTEAVGESCGTGAVLAKRRGDAHHRPDYRYSRCPAS